MSKAIGISRSRVLCVLRAMRLRLRLRAFLTHAKSRRDANEFAMSTLSSGLQGSARSTTHGSQKHTLMVARRQSLSSGCAKRKLRDVPGWWDNFLRSRLFLAVKV
jgi:hypothetical protein